MYGYGWGFQYFLRHKVIYEVKGKAPGDILERMLKHSPGGHPGVIECVYHKQYH